MAIELVNLVSGNKAAISSAGDLAVGLTQVLGNSGYTIAAGEVHDGSNGVTRLVRPVSVTNNRNLRVTQNNILWRDTFNHAIVPNDAYQVNLTTFTTAVSGGFWTLNASGVTTASAVARVQTYRTFEIFSGGLSTIFATKINLSLNPTTNTGGEIGFGYATGITTPTDGIYFKIPTSGEFIGCVNYNGTELSVNLVTTPVANTVYDLRIIINNDIVSFFINDILEGKINTPSTAAAGFMSRSLPIFYRLYNAASAPASVQKMNIAEVLVYQEDSNRILTPGLIANGSCLNGLNAPRGVATGLNANYANSAAPASATLSNTAAGYSVVGGQYQFAAVAGAETDYALFAYQIPVGGPTASGKNFWVNGITIDAFNMGAAVATTATLLQWTLGFGSTGVSLATGDGTATRAPRKRPLGVQSFPIGAAVGASASQINVRFAAPIMIEAGTFIHIILKMPVGTATASQIIRGIVGVDSYWE